MFIIGPKVRKGAGALIHEASADDPIYKRGFSIGVTNSSNLSLNTAEKVSPQSNEQSPQAKFVEQLRQRGVKIDVFSREDLKRKRSPDPKPGEWPRE